MLEIDALANTLVEVGDKPVKYCACSGIRAPKDGELSESTHRSA